MSVRSKLATFKKVKPFVRTENKKRIYALLRDEFRGTRKGTPRRDVEKKLMKLQGNPDLDALARVFPGISVLDYALLFVSRGLFELDEGKGSTYFDAVNAIKLASAKKTQIPKETLPDPSVSETDAKGELGTLGTDAPESDPTVPPKPPPNMRDRPPVRRPNTNVSSAAKACARVYFHVKQPFRNTPRDVANRVVSEKVTNLAKVNQAFKALTEDYGFSIVTGITQRLARDGHFLEIPANEPFGPMLDNTLLDDLQESSKPANRFSRRLAKFKPSQGSKDDPSPSLAIQHDRHTGRFATDKAKAADDVHLLEEATAAALPWGIIKLPNMTEIEPPSNQDDMPDTGRMRLFETQKTSVPVESGVDEHTIMAISEPSTSERTRDAALPTSVILDNHMHEHANMAIPGSLTSDYTRLPSLQEPGYDLSSEYELDPNGLRLYTPDDAEPSGSLHLLEPVEDKKENLNQKPPAPVTVEDGISPTDLWTFAADPLTESNEDASDVHQSVVERKDSSIEENTVDQEAAIAASTVSEPVLEQPTKSYEECISQLSGQMRDSNTESPAAEGILVKFSPALESPSSDQAPSPKSTKRKRRKDSSPTAHKYKPVQPTTETQHKTPDLNPKPEKSIDEKESARTEEVETIELGKHEATTAMSESAEVAVDLPNDHVEQVEQSRDARVSGDLRHKVEEIPNLSADRMRTKARNEDRLKGEDPEESEIRAEISKYATMPVPETNALYLPYRTQYKLLTHLQTSLEAVCFGYLKREHPHFLEGTESLWEIDCPESFELTHYISILRKHAEFDPDTKSKHVKKPMSSLYNSLVVLRHYAVHRKKAGIGSICVWNHDAYTFAMLLGDPQAAEQFTILSHRLKRTHRMLKEKRARYEAKLLETVKELAVRRAELDRLEKEAMANFVDDNKEVKDREGRYMENVLYNLLPESENKSESASASASSSSTSTSSSTSSSVPKPPTGFWGWCKSWIGA